MRDMKILPIGHVMIYFAYICVPFIGRVAKDGELYSRAYNLEGPHSGTQESRISVLVCKVPPFPRWALNFDWGTVRFVRLLPIRISYPDHSHPGWPCGCK